MEGVVLYLRRYSGGARPVKVTVASSFTTEDGSGAMETRTAHIAFEGVALFAQLSLVQGMTMKGTFKNIHLIDS